MARFDHTLLIIGCDRSHADQYRHWLIDQAGLPCSVLTAPYDGSIIELCQTQGVGGILLEDEASGDRALDLLVRINAQMGERCPPVIVLGRADVNLAVRSLKAGAIDYLVQDQITADILQQAVEAAFGSATPLTPSPTDPLTQSADLLQAMIENLPGGAVFVVDRNLRYWLAEGEALHAAGFEPKDLVGRTIFEVLPPELATYYESNYRQALAGKPFEHEHQAHDRCYISCGTPLRSPNGDAYAVLVVSYDISDRKRVEDERKQAEAALRESEEKYRTLFGSMDEAYAVVEVVADENGNWNDFLFLEVNPAFVKQTGMDYPVGRKATELLGTPNPQWAQVYGRVAETGEPIRFEEREATLDRVFDLYVFRLGGDGSRRVAVLFTDISDRKQAEAQLRRAAETDAFRVKLSDALRSLSDPVQIQAEACRLLGEQLGVDRAYYVEVHEAEGYARVNQHYSRGDSPSIVGNYPLSEYGWSLPIMRRSETIVITDTQSTNIIPDAERAAMAMIRMVGIVAIPLIKGEVLVGALAVNEPAPREWTEAEVELVRETAERIWADIQRAHAETALRQSEEKYRSLFTSIDEGFTLLEMIPDESGHPADFRIVETNPAWEQQTDLTNAVGKTLLEIAPNFEQQWLGFYSDVVISGRGRRTEYYTASVDRWYTVYASRIGGAGSRQVAVVFNDITDSKQAEEQQAFLLKLSDILQRLVQPNDIKAAAMRLLGEHLGVSRAQYHECDSSGEYYSADGVGYANGLPLLDLKYRIDDFGTFVNEDFAAGRPYRIDDLEVSPRVSAEEREAYRTYQIRAGAGVPLLRAGKLVAILAIHDVHPHPWTDLEMDLIRETAERIWTAVERTRTEKVLREAELQRVREQSTLEQEHQRAETLAELNHAKNLFFSNVSHEFRTPLTLLLGPLADAIADLEAREQGSRGAGGQGGNGDTSPALPLSPSPLAQLNLAHRNALRLLKLVNTLLDFSRVEAERIQVNYEPTDLAAYTANLASMFRSTIESAGLKFIVDCSPLPEPVYIDREMWEKIVLNLLSNAFKFTVEGEIEVRLFESSEFSMLSSELGKDASAQHSKFNTQHSKFVTLEVCDTGIGIPPDELPHIFERFYQSKSNQGRSYEGSGIGLALVQELVKLQGGTVDVTSEVGQGTTFTVTVPMGAEHLPTDARFSARWQSQMHLSGQSPNATATPTTTAQTNAFVQEAQSWQRDFGLQEAESAQEVSALEQPDNSKFKIQNSKSRILLVEDNADMRGYLQRLLDPYYEVETADDGSVALTMVQDALDRDGDGGPVYDLVLTDIMMPEIDGFELLRSLRENPDTREIPTILLSARAGEEAQIEGLEAGADDYLVKPFSARQLLARVNTHLQLAKMRRDVAYQKQITQEVQALNETLEQRVQARTAQLEAINQELDAFSYSVSHDLQTPLRYINSFVERLQTQLNADQADAASSLRYLGIIEQAAGQALKMINDLLQFSRMGKTPLRMVRVAMNELVEQVRSQLEPETIDRTIDWQIEPLPEVEGDPDLLRLVVQNLLSNAVKYTRDRRAATITIGSNAYDHEIVFFVQDNGAGFDMKYKDRLFSLFQRLHSQEQFAGTGVGLANVRRIVHRHGGRVWAEGAVEQGATFYVSLPKQEVIR